MSDKDIRIEWLRDRSDCETCGGSYAEGARVFLGDAPLLELVPRAHCFGGDNWESDEVYRLIFEKLGYAITVEHS